MKPLNTQERRNLYLQFLGFYIVTLVILIITMHFFYSVPRKELEALREQKEKFKSYDEGPRLVLKKMQEADALLKAIGDPASKEITKNEVDLQQLCVDIKAQGDAKKNPIDSIYIQIRNNYIDMMDAKRKERIGSGNSEALTTMGKQLTDAQDKLRICETQNEQYKLILGSK